VYERRGLRHRGGAVARPRSLTRAVQILFLTPGFLWPATSGGQVRTLSQLRVLSSLPQVERIRVFSMPEKDVPTAHRKALMREVPKLELSEPVFHPVHLFRYPRYVPRVVWLRAVRGVPYVAGKWDSPSVRDALRRELAAGEYDVVWLNSLGIACYLPLVRRLQPKARVVLDQHNVESDRFLQFARRQRGPGRAVAAAEWRAARRFERDVMRAVDAVGAIAPNDARAYWKLARVEARTIPQVASFARSTTRDATGPRLCWIGNLSWEPNARGITWFCREIWPLVRERLPDATLEIVGSGLATDRSGRTIAPLAWRAPGITTLGFVEELSPIYARSTCMVAPILGGTGIRIKLIEAFREGIPVVTTTDGASGLPIQSGREAFVEDEPAAFATRVVELASSSELRARLREAGYAFLDGYGRLTEAQAAVRDLLGLGVLGDPALRRDVGLLAVGTEQLEQQHVVATASD
jgi:glycosyltransferase involved in cell wall biosynthesis